MCGWICILLIAITTLPVKAAGLTTVQEWMERALQENMEYQLTLQDHALALQALNWEQSYGLKEASLSIAPLDVSTVRGVTPGTIGVQYGGELPYKISWSGSNGLGTDDKGKLYGNGRLQMQWNFREWRNQDRVTDDREEYLDEENRLHEARVTLLTRVVEVYAQVLRDPLLNQSAEKKAELAERKLAQMKVQYEAGLISAMVYFTAEDEYAEAVQSVEKVRRDAAKHLREFQKLYRQALTEEEIQYGLEDPVASLQWKSSEVELFLQGWDPKQAETYLKETYAYKKNQLALLKAEKALKAAQSAEEWQIHLGADCSYGIGLPWDLRASIGLSKSLFQPATQNQVHQRRIQLERQRLAVVEEHARLITHLSDQVAAVHDAEAAVSYAQADLQRAVERLSRLKQLYDGGYIALPDRLAGEIVALDKRVALIQALEQYIKAQLGLSKILK